MSEITEEINKASAFIKVQQSLKAPKDKENKFGNYNYRTAEQILSLLKPLLAESNASILIDEELVEINGCIIIKSTATYQDLHYKAQSSAFAGIDMNRKGMDIAQSFGASSSYAKKIAICNLFGIDDTKDADELDQGTNVGKALDRLRCEFVELATISEDPKVRECIAKVETFNSMQLDRMIKKLKS